jgi:hypothetical protein
VVQMAAWPSPTQGNAMGSQMAKDASPTGRRPDGSKATVSLPQVSSFAGWCSLMAQDHSRGNKPPRPHDTGVPLSQQVAMTGPVRLTASGQILTGSDAGMESGGQLNPRFSLWLMALPPAWASCGERAMRSLQPKPKRSSKPTSKSRKKSVDPPPNPTILHTMSLEDQLARLNANFERYLDTLGAPAAPAEAKTTKKAAKKKAAKEKPAESEETTTPMVDRAKKMKDIIEFVKAALTGAENTAEVQEKVTEVRKEFGVELVGDLADDQLDDFNTKIREALAA